MDFGNLDFDLSHMRINPFKHKVLFDLLVTKQIKSIYVLAVSNLPGVSSCSVFVV